MADLYGSGFFPLGMTSEEARELSRALGHEPKERTVTPSPFLRALARAFLLAPRVPHIERALYDVLSPEAIGAGVNMGELLVTTRAELEAEGLL